MALRASVHVTLTLDIRSSSSRPSPPPPCSPREHGNQNKASLHGAALVHAITGNTSEALHILAQLRALVEEDWARRRGRRGKKATATEGTSHASMVVMESLEAYLAAGRVSARIELN